MFGRNKIETFHVNKNTDIVPVLRDVKIVGTKMESLDQNPIVLRLPDEADLNHIQLHRGKFILDMRNTMVTSISSVHADVIVWDSPCKVFPLRKNLFGIGRYVYCRSPQEVSEALDDFTCRSFSNKLRTLLLKFIR